MAKEVSNKTVVILLVLLIIVSIIGFCVVSSKLNEVKLYPSPLGEGQGEDAETGTISLTIGEEPNESVDETTGMVSLTIK